VLHLGGCIKLMARSRVENSGKFTACDLPYLTNRTEPQARYSRAGRGTIPPSLEVRQDVGSLGCSTLLLASAYYCALPHLVSPHQDEIGDFFENLKHRSIAYLCAGMQSLTFSGVLQPRFNRPLTHTIPTQTIIHTCQPHSPLRR
jgi:hypothetical protein